LLPTLSGLVAFGDEEDAVGVVCLREVADAIRVAIPGTMMDEQCQLRELVGFDLLTPGDRNALEAAWVAGGEPVTWTIGPDGSL